jgi:hypothetical protein
MQKVVFSVTKLSKDEKVSGIGYLADGDLLIPAISSKNKPYIKVFSARQYLIVSTAPTTQTIFTEKSRIIFKSYCFYTVDVVQYK